MRTVDDPAALQAYKNLLSFHAYSGYIFWKNVARTWVDQNLSNYTTREIDRLMYANRDAVQQVLERRPEYLEFRFHYDFRLPISGRRIYIETVLIEDEEKIFVVSIHDA